MTLAPGTRLGQYEILSPLGAGGMGEVYRVRDLRLHRQVAIKVLPAETMNDPAARRRFEQEARSVAALSHPNILAIHHFDTHDGIGYSVTELLEGQTLRERLVGTKLPWAKAASIAAAICDGTAAAHQKGIIHRDLKPANIFLTDDGQVKILDFGLARARPAMAVSADASTGLKTTPGAVMGTLGYMSPEQLRGEAVDVTTDIFAIGCILYEVVSGRAPFARPSGMETAAAILHEEPPDPQGTEVPPALLRMIRRCLEKNRSERYQSARDLGFELRALLTDSHAPPVTAQRPRIRRRTATIIGSGVVLLLIATLTLERPWKSRGAAQPVIRSVVVMPFENGTQNPGMEYLSDGIPEGLINALARLPNLRVVARTTAFRYKGKQFDLADIRDQLKVDAVLSGRVTALGDDLVVQTDLVDTESGTQLWGDRFHEQSTDLAQVEQQIVRRISETLRMRLTAEEEARFPRPPTQNVEAYKLYLQGRFFWNKRTPEAVMKAKSLFEQAIKLDPAFALAYSGLSDSYHMLSDTYHAVLPPGEGSLRSEEAARTALRLDPTLAEAHASLGLIKIGRFQWKAAKRDFERAMEINPSYADALHWYSTVLLAEGRTDESLAAIRKAELIDPLSPHIVANVALRLIVKGQYAIALEQAQKGLELDPTYSWSYLYMGNAYEALGQLEKAVEAYERGAETPGRGIQQLCLVAAHALSGNRSEARRQARLIERAAGGEIANTWPGCAYAVIGDREKAFLWLTRAFDRRETQFRFMIRSPMLKGLRGDARYHDLIRRLERGFDE
ncbi:MAG TPA: protein kinase [Thermoanaerobaculia bacterium]|nr:protein kinase [Thermoanaerobaculia bacterium]